MNLRWSTCAFHTVDLLLNLNIYATGSKTFWLNDYLWKLHFLCTFFVRVNRLVKLYIFPCILIVFCILNLYDNFCINTVFNFQYKSIFNWQKLPYFFSFAIWVFNRSSLLLVLRCHFFSSLVLQWFLSCNRLAILNRYTVHLNGFQSTQIETTTSR